MKQSASNTESPISTESPEIGMQYKNILFIFNNTIHHLINHLIHLTFILYYRL